ncbi:MAG TPA: PKD domain-containing protein [Ktedonobacterales bacterium]
MATNAYERRNRRAALVAWGRVVAVAASLAVALNLLVLLPGARTGSIKSALACGLGNTPTMLANGDPALLYPIPPNTNVPADQPIGIFALHYISGQSIAFNEDLSRVPGAPAPNSLKWRWDFGDSSTTSGDIQPTHVFKSAGNFNVHAQIFDTFSSSWTDLDSAQIQVITAVPPNPPLARATASATAVVSGDSITFDASASQPLIGSHLKYEWNFNDATTATGVRVTHKFSIIGRGLVALLATDDRGARSVATINVGVVADSQQLPVAKLSGPSASVSAGQSVTFDGSQSTPAAEPAGDQITQYAWDFGDGTPAQTTQNASISHVYEKAGQYTVTLQAIDQQGTPAQATFNVTVGAARAAHQSGSATGGPNWLTIGAGVLLALLAAGGGFYLYFMQRQDALRERERQAAAHLRRARRIPQAGVRPGDSRWGDPRASNRGPYRGDAPGSRQGPPRPTAPTQPTDARNPRNGPPSR